MSDKLKKDSEVELSIEQTQLDPKLAEFLQQLAQKSEYVENNLAVLQKTDTKIEDFKDLQQRLFLKALYSQQKFKKDFAFASLMKALLFQNRRYFSFTKELLPAMVENDPDNPNKGKSFEMAAICKLMAEMGIEQLWDAVISVKKDEQRIAGYAVTNPVLLSLLKVDREMALQQFRELKRLAKNDWPPEDLIFDSCGESRVLGEGYRAMLEERRTKSSEPRTVSKASGCKEQSNKTDEKTSVTVDSSPIVTAAIQDDDKYQLLISSIKGLIAENSIHAEIKRNFKDFHSSYLELDRESFISYLLQKYKSSLLKHANDIHFSESIFKPSISIFLKKFGYSEFDNNEISSRILEAIRTV